MQLRKVGAAAATIAACALAVAPAGALAKKHSSPNGRHSISIQVSENPVVAGDQLAIFGRLTGPNHANRTVTLWHRINPRPRFTPIQTTTTDANGFYAFFRQKGIVNSNRNWYVKSLGARSRTVHERVFSLVTLSGPADGSTLLTGPAHKTTFTGSVSPGTVGDLVKLQRQSNDSNGNGWNTIDKTHVQPGGTFTIPHTFRVPGDANIRVLVKGTRRNIASASNVLSYEISQAQNPALTLNASPDPILFGQTVTVSGTLQNGANQLVTLRAKTAGSGGFQQIATKTTDGSGNYSFTEMPFNNTIYQVSGGGKLSAQVFEGVKDLLSANVSPNNGSPTTVNAGDPVTFSGNVAPNKTGHVIYLQRQNANGVGFHTVQIAFVGPGSTYSIQRRLFTPGLKVFRVFIPGGPFNQGAASGPFTIQVNPSSAQHVNGDQPDQTSEG